MTIDELNFSKAVKECFDQKFPDQLRQFNNKKEVDSWISNITMQFNLDNEEISKISTMPSYRWALDNYTDLLNEIKKLEDLKIEYEDILADNEKIKEIYRKELLELKKKYLV